VNGEPGRSQNAQLATIPRGVSDFDSAETALLANQNGPIKSEGIRNFDFAWGSSSSDRTAAF
jgi:hypothetical protein